MLRLYKLNPRENEDYSRAFRVSLNPCEMDMFIRFMYTKVNKAELNNVYLRTLENNERLAA